MSKILSSVLDKISENNNEYRTELRTLNNLIDEKTTSLVGEIVTLSGYVVDFSNTVNISKEKLVTPICRTLESYVIRDLRSVETVNEQFVEKINDKIENSNITSKKEKDSFVASLNELLNNKYLEIVKIKRVDFLNSNNTNDEIESNIGEFSNYLSETYNLNYANIENVIINYKNEVYDLIQKSLISISKLYLNNFVNEVSNALNQAIDYNEDISLNYNNETNNNYDMSNVDIPSIPEMPNIPEIPEVPEISSISEVPVIPEVPNVSEIPEVPEVPSIPNMFGVNDEQFNYNVVSNDNSFIAPELSVTPESSETNSEINNIKEAPLETKEVNEDLFNVTKPIDIPSISPVNLITDEVKKENKKSYDVDEILKIAKSPVVMMNDDKDLQNTLKPSYESTNDELIQDYNERELVEELINRLSNRLKEIDEREATYEENISKLKQDEAFVNDLIESSNKKSEELNKFENELNSKEEELNEKQKQLDKKINDVLPFANAVLKNE